MIHECYKQKKSNRFFHPLKHLYFQTFETMKEYEILNIDSLNLKVFAAVVDLVRYGANVKCRLNILFIGCFCAYPIHTQKKSMYKCIANTFGVPFG